MADSVRMTRERRQELFDSAVMFLRRHVLEADDDAHISCTFERGTREVPPSPDDGGFVRREYDGSASLTVSVSIPSLEGTAVQE
jgi:hypothetical protein